jgi:hypothetical protein
MSVNEEQISLFVATPVHSDVSINYFASCLDLQKECISNGVPIVIQLIKSSLVTQGRQLCVSAFLQSEATHLLFIDSDISFSTKAIKRMIAKNKDIMLIPYPVKSFDSDKVKKLIKEGNNLDVRLIANQYTIGFIDPLKLKVEDGVLEIERGPAGCMLIKREVFTKLINKYPNRKIKQHTLIDGVAVLKENLYNFFDTYWNEEDNTYTGEDFYFCKLCRDAGIKIYGLLDEYIVHHGDYGYKGRLIDELSLVKKEE